MPKIVKLRRFDPPNLLEKFTGQQINNATGTEFGSGVDYVYDASGDLRLWVKFNKNQPKELAKYDISKAMTLNYSGSVAAGIQKVYSSKMQSARFNNAADKNAEVGFLGASGNNNVITFGDGSSSDQPFSVSLWFKRENDISGESNFFAKGKSTSAIEYIAFYDISTKKITFSIYNGSVINRESVVTNALTVEDDAWHHIVFTYDGRAGTSANAGMKIYLDSQLLTTTPDDAGSYTYMDGVSQILHVGASFGGTNEHNGSMAEFAIWGKELSLDEIKAIYNWTYNDSVVKSGYTNLPPRVMLRELDNRPGYYPTKHRMGDKDRSGKNNIFYEDLPIKFGNIIEDEFKIKNNIKVGNVSNYDLSKWVVSNGMSIRREIREITGGEFERDECAVFSGKGTGSKRFIRTAKKIRNPYFVQFDLLQGPYNTGSDRLNLQTAKPSYTLKVQISTNTTFTSPTTIATYTPEPNNVVFYDEPSLSKKRGKTIKLGLADFPDPGQSYYLRIVQESYNSKTASWAIRNISIRYANQSIRYPININYKDMAGNKAARKLITTSHSTGSLSGIGRSIKNISDTANYFKTFEENASPFNETLVIENAKDAFFNEGLNPEVYGGFTTPTRSKTKFTVDLNTGEETKIGYINNTTSTEAQNFLGNDQSGVGQPLMCYWNNDLKRWEKVGRHVTSNNYPVTSLNTLKMVLSSSCVGFGPLGEIGTSPDPTGPAEDQTLFGISKLDAPENLQLVNKPITQFSFPFGPQYHATGSQYILAKDIGITKPFLLENCSLEFETKFELPKSASVGESEVHGGTHGLFKPKASNSQANLADSSLYIVTPTFFMLRQFQDNIIESVNVGYRLDTVGNPAGNVKVLNTLPTGSYRVVEEVNSGVGIDVYENREMITFGQPRLFMTASDAFPANLHPGLVFQSSITVEEMMDAGLSADLNIVRTSVLNPGPGGYTPGGETETTYHIPLTESLHMNFPCRNIGQYNDGSGTRIHFSNIETTAGSIYTGKTRAGRSNSSTKNSRGIVNGLASVKIAEGVTRFIASNAVPVASAFLPIGTPSLDSLDVKSPYVILPNDKLVFGWQYPVAQDHSLFPGTDSIAYNSMTLFGRSKLHLYGSEVVENKEFHETVNQNLTSPSVYEHIIGNEKIVDQWQVPYAGELTGSFVSNASFNYAVTSPDFPNKWFLALGSYMVDDQSSSAFRRTPYKHNGITHNKGVKRVGMPIISSVGDAKNKLFNYFQAFSGINDASARTFANSIYEFLNPKTLISDSFFPEKSEFVDGNAGLGKFYDDTSSEYALGSNPDTDQGSSYGTLLRDTRFLDTVLDSFGYQDARWLKGQGPKYSFNTKHFGYYSDMLRQGLDSKLESLPGQGITEGIDIIALNSAPVQAIFVSGTHKPGSEQKVYTRARLEFLLDDFKFQSSNINTTMTSSCPFIEDGSNPQNSPSNRGYEALIRPIITIPS